MEKKSWDSLWLEGHLLTMRDGHYEIIRDGAIAVCDQKIAWLGPRAAMPGAFISEKTLTHSLQQRWVTPGLIDCHTHLIYGGCRASEFAERLQGVSYAEIARRGGGIANTVALTRAASETELFKVSAERLQYFLKEGVTTIEIKSGYGLDRATELKMLHVAKQLEQKFAVTIKKTFLGAHVVPAEFHGRADDYIDFLCKEMLPAIVQENLADAVDAFCEKIAFTKAQIEKYFQAAQKLHLPLKLHAEQLSDQQGALLAAKYLALSADHLEYLTEEGARDLAAAGVVAVLLPGAYYFLQQTKKPPVDLLRQHRVPIAIATDCNPGTSPITSLLLIMNMACLLFSLTIEEAFAAVTFNAAKALGLAQTHGSLEVGKIADFAIWNIATPVDLVYYCGRNPGVTVVKNGSERGDFT